MRVVLAATVPPAPLGGTSVVYGALIGLAGVLITALVTQAWTHYRERQGRLAESQRTALYELQDAALDLRQAFRDYTDTPTKEEQAAYDRAESMVAIKRVRVLDDLPRILFERWMSTAEKSFLNGGPVHEEVAAWEAFNRSIGRCLRGWR